MKSRPDAVTTGPPALGVPVFETPRAVSSLYSPSGTRQTISAVSALIAISSPHGGALHGKPSGSSNGILTFPNDGSSPDDIDGRNSPAVPRLRVLTTISRRTGSNEAPDQLPPPSELGNTRLGTMPYGVYGPDCTIVSKSALHTF